MLRCVALLFASDICQTAGPRPDQETTQRVVELSKVQGFQQSGELLLYSHNTGLQNQPVVYVMDSINGTPRELLDPNTYRKDGTTALSGEMAS